MADYTNVPNPWEGWNIKRLIGRGSFGSVYEIERNKFGFAEKAALKVISVPNDESELDTLRSSNYDVRQWCRDIINDIFREYALMAQLKGCKNVVRCDDCQEVPHENDEGSDVCIRMELLTPLSKLCRNINEEEVVQIGKDICNALVECGAKDIIHRDIKPDNILVSDDGVYKLGDFGVAREMDHTTAASVKGTPTFMAPEVEARKQYGKDADIYSLGLVMYWLLNRRRRPFEPLEGTPTALKVHEANLRRLNGEILPDPVDGSRELKDIVLKACSYERSGRYSSASEMLSALDELTNAPAGSKRDDTNSMAHSDLKSEIPTNRIENEENTVGLFSSISEPETVAMPGAIADSETVGMFSANSVQSEAKTTIDDTLPLHPDAYNEHASEATMLDDTLPLHQDIENDSAAIRDVGNHAAGSEKNGTETDANSKVDHDSKKNKPKWLIPAIAALAVVVIVGLFAVIGGQKAGNQTSGSATETDSASSEEISEASAAGYGKGYIFKQGIDADYPPFSYMDDSGQPTGFDVELAQAVCDYYGWEYQAVSVDWDSKDTELESGNIDCIWSGFELTSDRENLYAWSDVYLSGAIRIIVPEGSDISSSADLAGKTVGVIAGTDPEWMLEDSDFGDKFAGISSYITFDDLLSALQTGLIDAIAINQEDIGAPGDYVILDGVICEDTFAIAFRTENTELRDKVNEALKALAENGTMNTIGMKYEDIYLNYTLDICLNYLLGEG